MIYQLLLFWSELKSCWTKASPPYIEHNHCLEVNSFGNQLEHKGQHLYDPFGSAAIQIQLEDGVCDFSSKMRFLNGCVARGGWWVLILLCVFLTMTSLRPFWAHRQITWKLWKGQGVTLSQCAADSVWRQRGEKSEGKCVSDAADSAAIHLKRTAN